MENHNGLAQSVNPDSDSEEEKENRLRVSENSQMAVLDVGALAAASSHSGPAVNTLNAHKSRIHMGPKITVVHNVDNNDKVKGRILGLELVSFSKRTRRLRCSVAVFLCWAFIVAIILTVVLFYVVLSAPPQRLDIGLYEPWYLRRIDWGAARDYEYDRELMKTPVRNVIIGHTATTYCHERYECIAEVQEIQRDHLARNFGDIGPHFVVGGEGLIFEGRGPNLVSAMVFGWNRNMIGIMFTGDYRTDTPEEKQIEHVKVLLDVLVRERFLIADYKMYGHCQVAAMISPGRNIMKELHKFHNWVVTNSSACFT